jgi:hypothetical protein
LILGPLLFIILTSGMADFLGVKEDETIVYVDDSNVWQTGSNGEEVARKLAEKAALFVEYTRRMGLSMNAAKTHLLFSSHAGNVSETTVEVDGNHIHPSDVIELLGVRYDRKLSTTPYMKYLLAAVRQRASVVARLSNHLPRGAYLRQLSYRLVMGKFLHALAAVARLRLKQEDNTSVIGSGIQVAFNNVAWRITSTRQHDHVTIEDLLDLAGVKSANRMVVKAIAAETWSCFHSNNGKDSARNHVGSILFSDTRTATSKTTRSATTRQIVVPLRGGDTFVTHAALVWNRSAMLRQVTTTATAKKASSVSLRSSPVGRDPRLRLSGCSLRVVGRLLRDVGHIPGDAEQVHQEVGHIFLAVSLSLPRLLSRGRNKRRSAAATRNKQDFL